MDDFEQIVRSSGGQLAELWEHIKHVLRIKEVGDMLKSVSNDECMDVIFAAMPPHHYQLQYREKHGRHVMQISLRGLIIWEWEITEIGPSNGGELKPHPRRRDSVLTTSFKLLRNGFIWFFVKTPKVGVFVLLIFTATCKINGKYFDAVPVVKWYKSALKKPLKIPIYCASRGK
jgi:hypothetical protein